MEASEGPAGPRSVHAAPPSEAHYPAAVSRAIGRVLAAVPDLAGFPDPAAVAPVAARPRPGDLRDHMVLRPLWKKRKGAMRKDAWARPRIGPAAAPAATNAPRSAV